MSCSYVLAGHTEIVLCLDTCISSSGRMLIVTGSKDNSVSLSVHLCVCVCVCLSVWGCLLLIPSCCSMLQVRLWNSESRHCIGVGVGHMGAVGAVAFSRKRREFFVSGSR